MEGLVNYSSEDEQDEASYHKKADATMNRERDGSARNYRRSSGAGGSGGSHKDEAYERYSGSTHQRDGGRRDERFSGGNYSRDNKDAREQRGRDSRDFNNGHKRNYDGRDNRDNRDGRDNRDVRDNREVRDNRDSRDNRDNRDNRSNHDRNYQRYGGREDFNRRERPRNDERYNNRHATTSSSSSQRPRFSGGNGNMNYDNSRSRYNHNSNTASRRDDERSERYSSNSNRSDHTRQQPNSNKYTVRNRRSRTRSRSRSIERQSPAKTAHTTDDSPARDYRAEKHKETTEHSHREIAPLMSLPLSDTAPRQPNIVAVTTSPVGGTAPTEAATVIQLPSYYNPSVINPTKYAEQVQKRKLLWGAKKTEDKVAAKWENAHFSQDTDGKVASKFMRLMGIKNAAGTAAAPSTVGSGSEGEEKIAPDIKSREAMFSTMEQQYEVARQVTHTMRGVGLGFGSSRPH